MMQFLQLRNCSLAASLTLTPGKVDTLHRHSGFYADLSALCSTRQAIGPESSDPAAMPDLVLILTAEPSLEWLGSC